MQEILEAIVGKSISIVDLKSKTKKCFYVQTRDKSYRVDLLIPAHAPWYLKLAAIQNIANSSGIEVPKVLETGLKERFFFKVSEWIDGCRVTKVQTSDEVLLKCGDIFGRLNRVITKDGFLTNSDFTGPNLVWSTDKRVFIVDTDAMKIVPEKRLDDTVVKSLLTWGIKKDRILLLLSAYSKYRDISGILGYAEALNWRWRKK